METRFLRSLRSLGVSLCPSRTSEQLRTAFPVSIMTPLIPVESLAAVQPKRTFLSELPQHKRGSSHTMIRPYPGSCFRLPRSPTKPERLGNCTGTHHVCTVRHGATQTQERSQNYGTDRPHPSTPVHLFLSTKRLFTSTRCFRTCRCLRFRFTFRSYYHYKSSQAR